MPLFSLSHQDSNLNRQNQNLQCYRYTMRQTPWFENQCKSRYFLSIYKKLAFFLIQLPSIMKIKLTNTLTLCLLQG